MIYTTYFAKVKDLPPNVIPISICGKAPDGWKGLEYKKFAPKWNFFKVWKETHDNDYYIEHYQKEVLDTLNFIKVIIELQVKIPEEIRGKMTASVSKDPNYHIALVCYEKPQDFCHRHLVAKWFEKNGIKVEEWRY